VKASAPVTSFAGSPSTANPLKDLSALQRVRFVMKEGKAQ
jgi:hypothetical protein